MRRPLVLAERGTDVLNILVVLLLLVKLPPLLPITVLPLNEPRVSLDVVVPPPAEDDGRNRLPQLVLCFRFLCLLWGEGVFEYCSSDKLRDEDVNSFTLSTSVGDLVFSDSSSSLI